MVADSHLPVDHFAYTFIRFTADWKPSQEYMDQSQTKNLCPKDEGRLSVASSCLFYFYFFTCLEGLVDSEETTEREIYVGLFCGFQTPPCFFLALKKLMAELTHQEPVKPNSS